MSRVQALSAGWRSRSVDDAIGERPVRQWAAVVSGWIDALLRFMETGGNVLWLILLLSIAMWGLILERFIFFRFSYPPIEQQWLNEWQARRERRSWYAHRIRDAIISEGNILLSKTVRIINALLALAPLLGLLGTVAGMIEVFDAMAVMGTGNARVMAAGISQATITTMAGMVVAISGLYFSKRIEELVDEKTRHLADLLTYE